MPGVKDITGMRFHRLTAVEYKGNQMWLFRCDCGNEIIRRGSSVRFGEIKSCGCLHSEKSRENGRNRATHGESKSKLYNKWSKMKARCYRKTCKDYPNYGGRGIKVCDEWMTYENFRDWAISQGYSENKDPFEQTIERIDVNGDYEPSNCKLANMKEQQNNRRNNHMVTIRKQTRTLQQWIDLIGGDEGKIRSLISNGMEAKEAILRNAPWRFDNAYFRRAAK